jgi:hypothetical protein
VGRVFTLAFLLVCGESMGCIFSDEEFESPPPRRKRDVLEDWSESALDAEKKSRRSPRGHKIEYVISFFFIRKRLISVVRKDVSAVKEVLDDKQEQKVKSDGEPKEAAKEKDAKGKEAAKQKERESQEKSHKEKFKNSKRSKAARRKTISFDPKDIIKLLLLGSSPLKARYSL